MSNFLPPHHEKLLHHLQLNTSFSDDVGIFSGKSMISIYLSQLAKHYDLPYLYDQAFSFLAEVQQQIGLHTQLGFGNGVAGFGCTLEYLCQQKIMEEDTSQLLEEPDRFVLQLVYNGQLKEWGIENGISGLGLYLLHRLRGNSFPSLFQQMRTKEGLIACVDRLTESKHIESSSADLSIWSGSAGILLFLHQVKSLGWYPTRVDRLMEMEIHFILENIHDGQNHWQKIEAWFALFHCLPTNIVASFQSQYDQYIAESLHEIGNLSLLSAPFFALLARLIKKGQQEEVLVNEIIKRIQAALQNGTVADIFLYDKQLLTFPMGLKQGVCGMGLSMCSLETGDYSWLSILGINIHHEKN